MSDTGRSRGILCDEALIQYWSVNIKDAAYHTCRKITRVMKWNEMDDMSVEKRWN